MKVFFLYQTPFPGDRALGMAEAEGLSNERLDQRLRVSMPVLPWEPAGLGVISNYLIIANFALGESRRHFGNAK